MSSGHSDPVRHHTVPRVYLKRFGSPGLGGRHPQVWVYPLHSGNPRPDSITDVTVVKHFYGPAESVLAEEIDVAELTAVLDGLESLVTGMGEVERSLFYSFLAVQMTRTPMFREVNNVLADGQIRDGLRVDPDPKAQELWTALQGREIRLETHVQVRSMASVAGQLAEELATMPMVLVRAPEPMFFITSDNPVAFGSLFDEQPLGLRNGVVAMALSPRSALVFSHHWPGRYACFEATSPEKTVAVAEMVRYVNGLIARCADRWIYADRRGGLDSVGVTFPVATFRPMSRDLGGGFRQTTRVLVQPTNRDRGRGRE